MKLTNIYGIHAVQAALDYSPEKIHNAWIAARRNNDQRLNGIINRLQELQINTESTDKKQLDHLADSNKHQGVVLALEMPRAKSEPELKQAVQTISGQAFFLVLDHVQDPHNLGACLRTADACGVHGIIITKDQASGITPSVCKVACGAAETVPVYQVVNLARTLRWLKTQQLWIVGAAGDSECSVYQSDLNMPIALVVGAEGKGMRSLTQKQCDVLIKLPMQGSVESLNLSVAAGVLLYEVFRQRITPHL